jgi:hypothetical protein
MQVLILIACIVSGYTLSKPILRTTRSLGLT